LTASNVVKIGAKINTRLVLSREVMAWITGIDKSRRGRTGGAEAKLIVER